MSNSLFKKGLVCTIIFLFISVSFQPIIAEKTISVEKESNYENVDFEKAKEYLFQTLVDISNNPKVKEFLNEHKHDLYPNDYDIKNAVKKILLQKPRLLKSILFTKPKMTYECLEINNKRGLEIFNILVEEESSNIEESYKIVNPVLFNELKNIILNDKELSNRISNLEEMNQELKSGLAFRDFPIICDILINWYENVSIIVKTAYFFDSLALWAYYHHHILLSYILFYCRDIFFIYLSFPILILLYYFGCISIWQLDIF